MVAARWIVGMLFAGFSLWIITLNWSIIVRRYLIKESTSSWIPLLGSCCGIVAVLVVPIDMIHRYWWVPTIIDWGTVPGFVHAAIVRARHS
jgi:hypothetical protein